MTNTARSIACGAPLLVLGILVCSVAPAAAQQADNVQAMITKAGNADSDLVRLRILKDVREMPDLAPELKADIDKMIQAIERWIGGDRLNYFHGRVRRNDDFDFGIDPESPVYPLTYLYRGRMVLAVAMQSGSIWSHADRRAEYFDIARGFFEKAAEAFGENRIARMYLGEPIPWPQTYTTLEAAPQWANDQHIALESLADIIEWWTDNRQREDGSYGGGWGDDCEMWRWWVPVLIAFRSEKIIDAQERFSEALMSQPHMEGGYTTHLYDVEHTAEDSSDAITPMMHLAPEDDKWQDRALRIGELMRDLWTGRNERGHVQFKSTYFSVDKVSPDLNRSCDTPYHTRAVQPTLLYWQRTGDPMLTALFTSWMDTWVAMTAKQERGKPAGIIPAAIHWPDGSPGGRGGNWWDPRNHPEYTLYQWPSAVSMLLDTLLLTYHMTGDETYMQPIRSMARIRREYLADPPKEEPEVGTKAWCARRLGLVNGTLAKYRALTGNPEFDDLLRGGASPYMHFLLTGDREPLKARLQRCADAFTYNFERYTSEVRYTDRVLRFPAVFMGGVRLAEPEFTPRKPRPSLIYSTATGDPGDVGYFPMNAVRWLTPPRDIAALVTKATTKEFAAELFHFGTDPRPMAAEFYLLRDGVYHVTLEAVNGDTPQVVMGTQMTVSGPGPKLEFELPARQLYRLVIARP